MTVTYTATQRLLSINTWLEHSLGRHNEKHVSIPKAEQSGNEIDQF